MFNELWFHGFTAAAVVPITFVATIDRIIICLIFLTSIGIIGWVIVGFYLQVNQRSIAPPTTIGCWNILWQSTYWVNTFSWEFLKHIAFVWFVLCLLLDRFFAHIVDLYWYLLIVGSCLCIFSKRIVWLAFLIPLGLLDNIDDAIVINWLCHVWF